MPEKATLESARKAKRKGRSASTQAGAFVREEIHHVREGKHGVASTKQAIAIGLAKARRAGVKLPSPPKRRTAPTRGPKREGRSAVTKKALASQARNAARRRSASARSASARKAARTKGPKLRHQAAQRAARTRQRRRRHSASAAA
jgi:Family of unknown function (DUF6496)